jgi:hypothetical protein
MSVKKIFGGLVLSATFLTVLSGCDQKAATARKQFPGALWHDLGRKQTFTWRAW